METNAHVNNERSIKMVDGLRSKANLLEVQGIGVFDTLKSDVA